MRLVSIILHLLSRQSTRPRPRTRFLHLPSVGSTSPPDASQAPATAWSRRRFFSASSSRWSSSLSPDDEDEDEDDAAAGAGAADANAGADVGGEGAKA